MKYVNVITKNIGGTYESEGGKFGDWEEHKDITVEGLKISERKHGDFPVKHGVKLGDNYILVYVIYDTGDSFGRCYGEFTEIALFDVEDLDKAKELVRLVTEDAEKNSEYDYSESHGVIKFEERKIGTNEWKGYFERFVRCKYELVTVIQ